MILKTIEEIVGLNSGANPLTQIFAKYFQPDKKMPPEVPPQLVALAAAAVRINLFLHFICSYFNMLLSRSTVP